MSDYLDNFKKDLEKVIASLEKMLSGVTTGRVSKNMMNLIKVDYNGSKVPISQLAAVSLLSNKELSVKPWDNTLVSKMAKAISNSDLKCSVNIESPNIYVSLSVLTEEDRKNAVIMISKSAEDMRVSVRNYRRKYIDEIKKQKKEGEFSEDDLRANTKKIDSLAQDYIQKVDSVIEHKKNALLKQ